MNKAYIAQLVEFLPEDSVYFRLNGVGRSRAGRLALALNDPKFGWNWVKSLNEDGLPLPLDIDNIEFQEANAYLRGGYIESMDEVLALAGPQNTTMRNVLTGLLVSANVTLASIANFMKISLDAARIFDQLFFNARDRLDEPGYITQLLNPDGLRLNSGTDNEGLLLLRAGFRHGAREVIRLAGVKANGGRQSLDALREDFEREILEAAATRVRHGADQDVAAPVVACAKALVIADKRIQREEPQPNTVADALGEIYKYHPVMETLERMVQPAIDRMIRLSQQNADKKDRPATPA